MQTFPSSETVILASSSPPLLLNPGGDDVDIDFGDVFGGPPKRGSKVYELTRHSFSDTALRRLDVNVDNSNALVPRDYTFGMEETRSLFSAKTHPSVILWSGSGWKAVPLMDLIEGNAVRKSYQRALLILHPDKLQQKGSSDNQKYTAEKVFELLQVFSHKQIKCL
ncbi:hypothetical protein Bca101_044868 [Brassica carinata]